ncbi:MAG: hypothetical protein H7146_03995 [Burkholderiaceae bacterium]|nr:hypothetical protein [Microbacteriaceae bacterium]
MPETLTEASALHPAPVVTEGNFDRLRILAADSVPRIGESVASSPHVPIDVVAQLWEDLDDGVRGCLARNGSVPSQILSRLARDTSAPVRSLGQWRMAHTAS